MLNDPICKGLTYTNGKKSLYNFNPITLFTVLLCAYNCLSQLSNFCTKNVFNPSYDLFLSLRRWLSKPSSRYLQAYLGPFHLQDVVLRASYMSQYDFRCFVLKFQPMNLHNACFSSGECPLFGWLLTQRISTSKIFLFLNLCWCFFQAFPTYLTHTHISTHFTTIFYCY